MSGKMYRTLVGKKIENVPYPGGGQERKNGQNAPGHGGVDKQKCTVPWWGLKALQWKFLPDKDRFSTQFMVQTF
jgi:hypothetical protein